MREKGPQRTKDGPRSSVVVITAVRDLHCPPKEVIFALDALPPIFLSRLHRAPIDPFVVGSLAQYTDAVTTALHYRG